MLFTLDSNNKDLEHLITTKIRKCVLFDVWCVSSCECKLIKIDETSDQFYYNSPLMRCLDLGPYQPILEKSVNFLYLDYLVPRGRIDILKRHLKYMKNAIIITNNINEFIKDFPFYQNVYVITQINFHTLHTQAEFLTFFLKQIILHRRIFSVEELTLKWQTNRWPVKAQNVRSINFINLNEFTIQKKYNNEQQNNKPRNACKLCG